MSNATVSGKATIKDGTVTFSVKLSDIDINYTQFDADAITEDTLIDFDWSKENQSVLPSEVRVGDVVWFNYVGDNFTRVLNVDSSDIDHIRGYLSEEDGHYNDDESKNYRCFLRRKMSSVEVEVN